MEFFEEIPKLVYPKFRHAFYRKLSTTESHAKGMILFHIQLCEFAQEAGDEDGENLIQEVLVHIIYRFYKCSIVNSFRVLTKDENDFVRYYERELPLMIWPLSEHPTASEYKSVSCEHSELSVIGAGEVTSSDSELPPNELCVKSECSEVDESSVPRGSVSSPVVKPPKKRKTSRVEFNPQPKTRKKPKKRSGYSNKCHDLTGGNIRVGVDTSWHHAEYWSGKVYRDPKDWDSVKKRAKSTRHASDLVKMATFVKDCKRVFVTQDYEATEIASLLAYFSGRAYVGKDFVAFDPQRVGLPRCKMKIHRIHQLV